MRGRKIFFGTFGGLWGLAVLLYALLSGVPQPRRYTGEGFDAAGIQDPASYRAGTYLGLAFGGALAAIGAITLLRAAREATVENE